MNVYYCFEPLSLGVTKYTSQSSSVDTENSVGLTFCGHQGIKACEGALASLHLAAVCWSSRGVLSSSRLTIPASISAHELLLNILIRMPQKP